MRLAMSLFLLPILFGACATSQPDLPLTTSSDEAREHFLEGLDHFNLRGMSDAREAFERAVSSDPEFAIARAYLAISMNYTGDVEAQWRAGEASLDNATEIEKRLFESHRAWGRSSYDTARDTMRRVLDEAPGSRQAHFELGWFHYKLRDYEEATKALSEALAIDDSFLAARILLAEIRLTAEDLDGAAAAIDDAIALDPSSALAHSVRGDIFRNRGQLEDAIRAYDEALALDDTFVPALDGRAASLRIASRYDEAASAYRDLCDATQKLADGAYKELFLDWRKAEDVCFDYGMTYLLTGDAAQTAQVFEATADYTYETRLENAPIFYNSLGRFYLEQGELATAEAVYDRSLRVSLEVDHSPYMRKLWDGRHLHAKARIRARQGRFDDAMELVAQMKSMIDEGGDDAKRFLPTYHYLLGYVLLERREFESALEHLKQSQLADPFNRWLLARAHDGVGNRSEARAIAEELAGLAPGSYGHALAIASVRQWLAAHPQSRTSDAPGAMERLPDDDAGDLVRRAIESAGGFSAWRAKRSVSYRKTTTFFASDGSIERTMSEKHQYLLRPALKVRIERDAGSERIDLINSGANAWKYVDGEPATEPADVQQAWGATFGSHYVFSMPFKLTDPGVLFTRVAREALPDGTPVDTLVVDYADGAGRAAGAHTWTYYFSPEDGRLVANHLRSGTKPSEQSFSTYADYETIDGIHLPTKRTGWGYTDDGIRGAKRSEIIYTDIRFDVELSDALFRQRPIE